MNFSDLMSWIIGREDAKTETEVSKPIANRRVAARLNFPNGVVQIQGVGDFPLIDLAQRGLSLNPLDQSILANPQPGMILPSKIRLGTIFLETDLKVCYLESGKIGCSFGQLSFGHSRILNDFLKPCILGASLREIRSREENQTRFEGDDSCQLFYWKDSNGVFEQAELYFMDYAIIFDGKSNSLRTGFFRLPFGSSGGRVFPEKSTIVFNATPSYRVLKMAHLFFNHAALPEDIYLNLASIAFREEKCSFSKVLFGEKDKGITFNYFDEFGEVKLKVASLCSTAISALLPDPPPKRTLKPGTVLSGILNLPEHSLTASFKVVFQQDFMVGGGLRLQNSDDSEFLSAFLAPRLLGRSLEALPPPTEKKPFSPGDAQSFMYVGIHNTHLLSLVVYPKKLLYGRLAFNDRIVIWDKNSLAMYSFPQGLVFPYEWDILTFNHEEIGNDDPTLLGTVREILNSSNISSELKEAWEDALCPSNK